ncbi:MAG TPA: ATPase, T2SS/T4P/T4SS family, partial [Candidatus Hydrogenedentes bacterium]|nr:ATPase, T2SS/T4P/T4SS family [Candidatus Hydrogenedentota bacterium]
MATSEEAAGQDAGSSGITLHKILAYAVKYGASDIHLKVPRPPAVRIDGVIRFIGDTPLTQDDMLRFLDDILTPEQKARFLEVGDADCALGVPGLGRFRVNCLKQRGTVGIVLRHVKGKAPNFDMLNLPEASMMKIVEMRRGLVLVTGTTGSGKSTTLAAIIDNICRKFRRGLIDH